MFSSHTAHVPFTLHCTIQASGTGTTLAVGSAESLQDDCFLEMPGDDCTVPEMDEWSSGRRLEPTQTNESCQTKSPQKSPYGLGCAQCNRGEAKAHARSLGSSTARLAARTTPRWAPALWQTEVKLRLRGRFQDAILRKTVDPLTDCRRSASAVPSRGSSGRQHTI